VVDVSCGDVVVEEGKNPVRKAFEWAVSVDVDRATAQVAELREKHRRGSNPELARRLLRSARWWATGTGFVSSLPSNPWVAGPAGLADAASVLRIEIALAARIALLYDEAFFDDETAAYELLVPIFGAKVVDEVLREMTLSGGMDISRQVMKKYLTTKTLREFKKIMLKVFGVRATQKGVVTKTIPILGALAGGVWNFSELTVVGKRTIAYFENEPMDPEPPDSDEPEPDPQDPSPA
jgi:hypothetical protein